MDHITTEKYMFYSNIHEMFIKVDNVAYCEINFNQCKNIGVTSENYFIYLCISPYWQNRRE